ncbi:hypothetical protein B0T10DRAFT_610307 [Thelonectria olida]|uniref:Uncharacterized protein n=1 Tax=Thelonectria olida TaxID=1576542 RepID=A0A9P8VUL7_9HYPO|nr:hypothetical protein B0T10DRAFT_610307 [Thelonectria olida]
MATVRRLTTRHQTFNGGHAEVFPNDYTSTNEIDRQTRLAEKLKAEKDAARRDADELITLRALKISLEADVSRAQQEVKTLRESKAALESRLQDQILEPKNNLDPVYHGRYAQIHSTQAPHFAVDLGGESAHGWPLNLENPSQHLKLEKTDPNYRHSSWTISRDGNYLEFIQEDDDYRANKCGYRRSMKEKELQEWYIGCSRVKGGFVLENVGCGYSLLIQDAWAVGGGAKLRPEIPNEGDIRQLFRISIW